MKFCPTCSFKYSDVINNSTLMEICNHCGTEHININPIISETIYKTKTSLTGEINYEKNAIHDSRYQRTNKYKCINDSCPTNTDGVPREAVTFPNKNNLRRIFICRVCNNKWTK
jgi:hypothetical protein